MGRVLRHRNMWAGRHMSKVRSRAVQVRPREREEVLMPVPEASADHDPPARKRGVRRTVALLRPSEDWFHLDTAS